MSIAVMSRVWSESKSSGTELLVLLALADYSDDEGVSWPSIRSLAKKARVTERRINQILNALRESGEVSSEATFRDNGSSTSNRYALNFTLWVKPASGGGCNGLQGGDATGFTPGTVI